MVEMNISKAEAKEKIHQRIVDGNQLLQASLNTQEAVVSAHNIFHKWTTYNSTLLKTIFKDDLVPYEYDSIDPFVREPYTDHLENRSYFRESIRERITMLESISERLDLYSEPSSVETIVSETSNENLNLSKEIFIVHGHDESAKEAVARLIEKVGLEALILHEKPNKGRTIIQKFEDYSNVGFAVILLTPDDVGAKKSESSNLKSRARQNVILELGFFLGKLGIEKVCVLHKGDIDIPSDYKGVIYIPFDEHDGWRLKLIQELKAAGYEIDLNKIVI